MSQNSASQEVIGTGGPELSLSPDEQRAIVAQGLACVPAGARALAIIPDKTRDDNTDLLFPFVVNELAARGVARLDALAAQGTHVPMTDAEKRAKIGCDGIRVHDHDWNNPDALVTIGELSQTQVSALTGGLINRAAPINLNRLLAPGRYDTILVFGATVPHEVAGFAGGAKYFFPGVAGPDLTHATHWLGALAGIENVIGRIETPARRLIEAAAALLPQQVISLNSVVNRDDANRLHTHALFVGDINAAFRRAAAVSSRVHIRYTGRKYKRVLALLDEHYDELWVGGKASYKLGGVIEEGGELIIYAPHLRAVSVTHGALIEKYGYAPLERVRQMVSESPELQQNLCVAAHLAHVAYAGAREGAAEGKSRFRITLATALDELACRRVRLGYADFTKIRREDYADSDTLVAERAGRDLYLVAPHD